MRLTVDSAGTREEWLRPAADALQSKSKRTGAARIAQPRSAVLVPDIHQTPSLARRKKPGPKGDADLARELFNMLRVLDNIWEIERVASTVLNMSAVRERADRDFKRSAFAQARAARTLVLEKLASIAEAAPDQSLGRLAHGLAAGMSLVAISRLVGCRPETLTRAKHRLSLIVLAELHRTSGQGLAR